MCVHVSSCFLVWLQPDSTCQVGYSGVIPSAGPKIWRVCMHITYIHTHIYIYMYIGSHMHTCTQTCMICTYTHFMYVWMHCISSMHIISCVMPTTTGMNCSNHLLTLSGTRVPSYAWKGSGAMQLLALVWSSTSRLVAELLVPIHGDQKVMGTSE